MKTFSALLSLAALALPVVVNGEIQIAGSTEPYGGGDRANKLINGGELCFNLDDPNIVGGGDPAVFQHMRSTMVEGNVPAEGWLYRGRDCHDDDPLFVDGKSGYSELDPPYAAQSCKLTQL